jgi:hypothetical protein
MALSNEEGGMGRPSIKQRRWEMSTRIMIAILSIGLTALSAQAVDVPLGVYSKDGRDADFTATNVSSSGFTGQYQNDTDTYGDSFMDTTPSTGISFYKVGDKLTYKATYENLAIDISGATNNTSQALRAGFAFANSHIYIYQAWGAVSDFVQVRLSDSGRHGGGGAYSPPIDDFFADTPTLKFATGNTYDATYELTLAEITSSNYTYNLNVTYSSATETGTFSHVIADAPDLALSTMVHGVNSFHQQVDGQGFTVSNTSLDFEAAPGDFLLSYTKIGADVDSVATNLSASGGELKFISNGDSDGTHETGMATALDGGGVTFNVGDKLTYTFDQVGYGHLSSTVDEDKFHVGFSFGTAATLYHTRAGHNGQNLNIYMNTTDGSPFTAGSLLLTKTDWSDSAHKNLRFQAPNNINSSLSLTLQTDNGDGTYDFLYEMSSANAEHSSSISYLYTNVPSRTVTSIFHSTVDDLTSTLNFWTVSNAKVYFDGFATPFQSWAEDFGLGGVAGDVDSDLDGLKNLAEYAFGGNPTNSESQGEQPKLMEDGGLKYVYRIIADPDITHQVVTETDLSTGAGSISVTLDGSGPDADPDYTSYTNTVDTSVEDAGFLHVEVSN